MCEQLVELREAMSGYATRFDAALLSASLAERVVETATAIEHMAAAVKSLAAARVAETEAWKRDGDRSPAHQLARKTGTSVGQANDAIATGRRLSDLPATKVTLEHSGLERLAPAEAESHARFGGRLLIAWFSEYLRERTPV